MRQRAEAVMKEIVRIGVEGMWELPADGLPRFAEYRAGVADGAQCLRDGCAITKRRLIAINDSYSAGFRAGYFQRDT